MQTVCCHAELLELGYIDKRDDWIVEGNKDTGERFLTWNLGSE